MSDALHGISSMDVPTHFLNTDVDPTPFPACMLSCKVKEGKSVIGILRELGNSSVKNLCQFLVHAGKQHNCMM